MELTRRYSGGRISLKDDFDIDFNDISRASTPMSTLSSKSEGRRRERTTTHHHHSIDDYKRKVARLKSELEMERARNKQVYREKSVEMKLLREAYEADRQQEIAKLEKKLNLDKEKEVEILQQNISKKKDKELQEVLRYKEDELKALSTRLIEEKEQHLRSLKEDEKKQYSENLKKMEQEVNKLKQEKDAIRHELKKKLEEESKKDKEFSEMKEGYDAELRRIISESKKLALGNLQKLKKAEKALSEGGNMSCEDTEVHSISELGDRMTPFTPFSEVSELSSRAASSVLGFKLEDLRLDDLKIEESDLENLIASARSPANVPTGSATPFSLPSKSPAPSLVSPPPNMSEQDEAVSSENRRLSEEKDRQLQKRVTELQTQTQRLERKISLLKSENDSLKKRHDDQKPLEEKIKTLKKRNAELAALARRLEEKAKHLQQENMKKIKEETGHQDSEQLKRMFARQRARDLADHAKVMLSKDREIEDLRRECQRLAESLSNGEFLGPENIQMYEEKEELVSIIKGAAKERLLMEKQLAKIKPTATVQAEAKRLKELEVTNEALQREITRLEKAKGETEKLEVQLAQKKIECEALNIQILQEKERCRRLEGDLQDSAAQNTQLTVQVSDLQRRLHDLEKVNEECNVLRLSLTEAQHECDLARNERNALQSKVHDLELCVKNLQSSAEKLSSLEHDYETTKLQLQEKQADILTLQQNQDDTKRVYEDTVAALQTKLIELQHNCEKQEAKHQSLSEQLKTLQAANNNSKLPLVNSWAGDINHKGNNSPSNKNNNHSSSSAPVTESFQSTQVGLSESSSSGKLTNGGNQVESTKSLDTGFADDDETELDNSNLPSPDQDKVCQSQFEDPELYEIGKKLKELEATDSEEEILQSEDKGDDSGMECNREKKINTENSINGDDIEDDKKIPVKVFFAKYSYNPFEHSPNENPDAELAINAGEFVLVHGEMDEDAFFDGELLDGRRGLVPSNFVELVKDEDLPAFHAAMVSFVHHDDDHHITSNSVPQDLDYGSGEADDRLDLLESVNHDDLDTDLSRSPKALYTELPYPWKLTLDRQLTNSILISWKPPVEGATKFDVKSYHVYVDGDFKAVVRSNERTKALVENVDSKTVHRVSVRCVSNLGQSDDSFCTILVGKDAVPVPSQLKVTDLTPNSASISWLPGNSNFQHSISANSCEICVVKPGIFSHIITGLDPSTDYTLTVTALTEDTKGDNLSTTITFKTPAGGLPDPPLNMQVEAGPQEGTLLLTWLPVTIDTSGFSNGAGVAGYVVYADGRRIKEAHGPTNDHIVLSAKDFQGFIPKQLMVRTLTRDKKESSDSNLIKLPQSLIREITAEAAKSVATEAATKVLSLKQKSPIHRPDMKMSDQINLSQAYREMPEDTDVAVSPVLELNAYDAEEYIDSSSSSELSDILEVEEEKVYSSSCASTPDQLRAISLDDLEKSRSSPVKVTAEDSSKPTSSRSIKSPPTIKVETTPDQQVSSPPSNRVVPAIEITRDSSSERGNSFEVSEDEIDSNTKTMKNGHAKCDSPQRSSPSLPQNRTSPSITNINHSSTYQRTSPSVSEGKRSPIENQKIHEQNSSSDYSDYQISEGKVKKQIEKLNEIQNSDFNKSHVPGPGHKSDQCNETSMSKLDNRTSDSPKHIATDSPNLTETDSPKHKGTVRPTKQPVSSKHLTDHDSNANELISNEHPVRHKHPDVPSLNLNDLSVDESTEVDSISGEINPPVEDSRVRLFVALFDYDPETMSPNVDAIDEELPFKEGQIIKIYGDKDIDGFYRGECNNMMGFVPCNMVSEVQVDDAELAEQLLKESQEAYSSNSHLSVPDGQTYTKSLESLGSEHLQNGLSPMATVTGPMRRMVALYDYDPQELSPNVDAEVELSFHNGDIIMIFGEMDDDGFFMGEINGQRGLVPSNFLQEAPLSDEDVNEGASIISPTRSGGSLSNLSGSRQSDLDTDKTTDMGPGLPLESLPNDWVDSTSQNHTPTRSCSVSPEDKQQKKRGGGILSKGKSIFKKFTR